MKNDLLELSIESVRPNLKIAEIFFEDAWHPWHVQWLNLEINKFLEDFEIVKNKLIQYYKDEKASCTLENGATIRKPGRAVLETAEEEWRFDNCKIVDCQINEENKKVGLSLWFDGVSYKILKSEENIHSVLAT